MKPAAVPSITIGLMTIGLLSMQVSAAQILFQDDFSGGISAWNSYHGSVPDDSIAKIVSDDGNPPPCLLLDDSLNNGAWALSKQTFQFVGKVLEISTDMKQGNAAFVDQRSVVLGINKSNHIPTTNGEYVATLGWTGSTNPNDPGTGQCSVLYSNGGTEQVETSNPILIADPDGWHNAKLRIRADGKVDFFVDSVLVYSSVHTLVSAYDGPVALSLGGRRSLYDNALVTLTPTIPGDFDGDGDVDQSDYGIFQRCFSGPSLPGDPDCGRVNIPPRIGNMSVKGNLLQGQRYSITVSCAATDGDGTVESVTADLSSIGSNPKLELKSDEGNHWTNVAEIMPLNAGTQQIVLTAIDNDGATGTGQATIIVSDEPVGDWRFEEGSGNVLHDATANGNNGAFTGNAAWANEGPPGESWSIYSTSSDFEARVADSGSFLDIMDNFTIEGWVRLATNGLEVLAKHHGHGDDDGSWNVVLYRSSADHMTLQMGVFPNWTYALSNPVPIPPDGSWIHIAITFNDSTNQAVFYINGSEAGTESVDWNINDTGEPLTFGYEGLDPFNPDHTHSSIGDNRIGSVKMYKYVRTPVQIAADAHQPNNPPTVTSPSVQGNLIEQTDGTVSVSCSVADDGGPVQSVVVDLSSVGGSSTQHLEQQSEGEWRWSGQVKPPHAGPQTITFTAMDNQGTNGTAQASVQVKALAVVLVDDFSNGLLQWEIRGTATIDSSKGNLPPCVYTTGFYPAGWIKSKSSIDYVGKDVRLSADVNGGGRDTDIELMRDDCPNRTLVGIFLNGSTAESPNTVICSVYAGPGDIDSSGFKPIASGDGWHRTEMHLLASGLVEFSLDGVLVYTSHKSVSTAFSPAYFMLGGWSDYYDNARVETTTTP